MQIKNQKVYDRAESFEPCSGWKATAGALDCFPYGPKQVMTVALLLVKYCLLGGATRIVSPSLEMCTRGVAGCVEPECSDAITLVLLRPGDWGLGSPAVTTSVNIGSTRGSAEGVAWYDSCFLTAAISTEGLELAKHAGVSWGLFLRLGWILLVKVTVEWLRTLHCL